MVKRNINVPKELWSTIKAIAVLKDITLQTYISSILIKAIKTDNPELYNKLIKGGLIEKL